MRVSQLLSVLLVVVCACEETGTRGEDFENRLLAAYDQGLTQKELVAQLGDPETKDFAADGTEVWTYQYHVPTTKTAMLRFRDGKVVYLEF